MAWTGWGRPHPDVCAAIASMSHAAARRRDDADPWVLAADAHTAIGIQLCRRASAMVGECLPHALREDAEMALPEAIAAAKIKFPGSVAPHAGPAAPISPAPHPAMQRLAAPFFCLWPGMHAASRARLAERGKRPEQGGTPLRWPTSTQATALPPRSGSDGPWEEESCHSDPEVPTQAQMRSDWKIQGAPDSFDAGGRGPAECPTQ